MLLAKIVILLPFNHVKAPKSFSFSLFTLCKKCVKKQKEPQISPFHTVYLKSKASLSKTGKMKSIKKLKGSTNWSNLIIEVCLL